MRLVDLPEIFKNLFAPNTNNPENLDNELTDTEKETAKEIAEAIGNLLIDLTYTKENYIRKYWWNFYSEITKNFYTNYGNGCEKLLPEFLGHSFDLGEKIVQKDLLVSRSMQYGEQGQRKVYMYLFDFDSGTMYPIELKPLRNRFDAI